MLQISAHVILIETCHDSSSPSESLTLVSQTSTMEHQHMEECHFSDRDESSLPKLDSRVKVWRRSVERHADCCIGRVTAFGGGSIITVRTPTRLNLTVVHGSSVMAAGLSLRDFST